MKHWNWIRGLTYFGLTLGAGIFLWLFGDFTTAMTANQGPAVLISTTIECLGTLCLVLCVPVFFMGAKTADTTVK